MVASGRVAGDGQVRARGCCRSYCYPVPVALVVITRNLIPRIDLMIDLHAYGMQAKIGAAGAYFLLVIEQRV